MRAVQFDGYGDVDVLRVAEVATPTPADGQLLVRVKAAGINPFESKLRQGLMQSMLSLTFPSGQGTDVAGVVEAVGAGVSGVAVGDEVLGSTGRQGSEAELALLPAANALPRPAGLSWELAGGLWTVGTTAAATVAAVAADTGDVVVVVGAAGGVGGLAAQLARRADATVLGIASERNHDWLRSVGVRGVTYGDGLVERLSAAADAAGGQPTALIDTVGAGYVELGIELGIAPERIDTIADYAAAGRVGAKTEGGAAVDGPATIAELASLIATGELELRIERVFPLAEVRAAYTLLEHGHAAGKIVLTP